MSDDPPKKRVLGAISMYSALMALVGAFVAGLIVLLVAKVGKYTPGVGVYHAFIFGAFFAMYMFIPGGFEEHFATPTGAVSASDVAYYTAVTHATIGYGDMYPKTQVARRLVMAHVFLVFIVAANIVPVGETVFSYAQFVTGD